MREHTSAAQGSCFNSFGFPDRRLFLGGLSGVLVSTFIPGVVLSQQEHSSTNLNADQRIKLLSDVSAIIQLGGNPEARIKQMELIKPLVEAYRNSLREASDINLKELALAIELVRSKINMMHFADHIPKDKTALFINEIAIDFYEELLVKLRDLRSASFPQDPQINTLFDYIRNDLLWSQIYHNPLIAARVGEVVCRQFILEDPLATPASLKPLYNFDHTQHNYYQALLLNNEEKIIEVVSNSINQIKNKACDDPKAQLESILDFVTSLRNLSRSITTSTSSESPPVISLINNIEKQVSDLALREIVPLWCLANQRFHQQGRLVDYGGVIKLFSPAAEVTPHSPGCPLLTQKIVTFCQEYKSPSATLGNYFMSSYQNAFSQGLTQHLNLYDVSRIVALIPTPPDAKHEFISQLREMIYQPEILKAEQVSFADIDRAAGRIASIFRALLLSEHCFASAAENKTYDSHRSLLMFNTFLLDAPPDQIDNTPLYPTQKLLLELASITTNSTKGVNGANGPIELDNTKRFFFDKILEKTTKYIYQIGCNDIYSREADQPLRLVSFIEGDIHYSMFAPEKTREIAFCHSMRDLVSYADILAFQLAQFKIVEPDEQKLLERLILLTDLIETRGTHAQINGQYEAKVEAQIAAHFPYISEDARSGPFVQVYRSARNILYQHKHNRLPPWDIAADSVEGARLRDKSLDLRAHELATSAEATLIATFCLVLIQPYRTNEYRPIDSHKTLSTIRLVAEVHAIVSSYGLLDNHSKLREIFAGNREEIVNKLIEFRDQEILRQKEIYPQLLLPAK
jgi:hypothetical protein